MKKIIILFTLLSAISCKDQIKEQNNNYVIQGQFVVDDSTKFGINPVKLSLVDEDKGINQRTTVLLDNQGYFEFNGKLDHVKSGTIYFEDDLINFKSSYQSISLIMESDTIFIKLKVNKTEEDYLGQYLVREVDFLKGPLNIRIKKLRNEMYELFGEAAWRYSDPDKMKEIVDNHYPKAQENLLNFFHQIKNEKQNEAPIIKLLRMEVVNNNDGPLGKDYISLETKKELESLIGGFSSSVTKSRSYKKLYEALTVNHSQSEFKDFKLVDKEQKQLDLSSIIEKNEYTVLYFWWSGCGPCRAFNKSITDEHLALLKAKGINLVSINFDTTIEMWKTTSAKDEIKWTNLYSGSKSDMYYAYDVQRFPTKLIFDKNKHFVDHKFKDIQELLKLSSNQ